MGVREAIIQPGLKHLLDTKVTHNAYILDDQGKEVQITTAMIRTACHQLLKQCRSIKN
ncbi:PA1571 family protein [Acinetobacter johnsonii]|uniref:PA1571 family protein n=1 Tax=Acinetobacter johnsonii TaxID=40214 RepID=UPI00160649A8|nr:PA1571 family protein [Acinetobacter johnsonii]QQT56766.1 hypothetical protein I6I50_10240 [Acinetobacter johnsonii]